ncbi:MAG TPA: hypothetical protein PLP33_28310 [Leptospiraceae bacterium]|nr:hypothetical protein [Leptospiraceae bacterium]HMW08550.1 hypothetical protein [Leptospiraceae bacterium]HNA10049.1 hypothetical protein [Leptospiraceae bacterium]HNC00446.1 hypothetical protein [Leptospiraceae bacterium]HNC59364.1 hypothetical protein [Leptospiraceae bacterium]
MPQSKKHNKTELEKLGKGQNAKKKRFTQKDGRKKKPVGTGRDLSTTEDANVTIKPRAVKIKPAA